MCRRQIGLWNYISSASCNRLSTESDEEKCEEGEPTPKKKRVSVCCLCHTFYLIAENKIRSIFSHKSYQTTQKNFYVSVLLGSII